MSALVYASQPSHYYKKDGTPVYEVPMASKKGEMRAATLADARKQGLYPSVTTVMSILQKPALEAWKTEQAVLSCLTLPVIAGETMDDRARRAVKDSQEQVEKAAKTGHLIHAAIEEFLLHAKAPADPTITHLLSPFIQWWSENCTKVHYCEHVVVHEGFGYAGRVDCKADFLGYGTLVVDFKTRKPNIKGVLRTYDEDGMQLSAYREADSMNMNPAHGCASILINSEAPGVIVHHWDKDELSHHLNCFTKLLALWKCLKKFDPTNPALYK